MRRIGALVSIVLLASCAGGVPPRVLPRLAGGPGPQHALAFPALPAAWDEGLPLGNAILGELVWANGPFVRLSLDRADLWDLRPMKNLDTPEWSYRWVVNQWKKGDYGPVQERFDVPYDAEPAPSKIPAAALELDASSWGEPFEARLTLENALASVRWKDGKVLETFVSAGEPVGWIRLKGAPADFKPVLRLPPYAASSAAAADPVTGQDLRRLGYKQGAVRESEGFLLYRQDGWGGFYYSVAVGWRRTAPGVVEIAWSASSRFSDEQRQPGAADLVLAALRRGFDASFAGHASWWAAYWSRSAVRIPDPLLEKQWYLEQYKFGSAARRGAPPISLQAVWTADNGKLPPWKGDFHHDLNTELSYWPCYAADHLEEGLGFLDWLWDLRGEFKAYTKAYFGTDGLNVPGVSTLTGRPMGGWIQYSFSPTIGAWLGQNFYLHWRYSRDRAFLAERAYPWIADVAVHLEQLSERDGRGRRRLPASSSPEIFDNSAGAWFAETTNFDLALVRWTFAKAAELAVELGKKNEAAHWRAVGAEWPDFAVDPADGLMVAPGAPYAESHRHFSHLMAFHPLGLLDVSNGPAEAEIIRRTLATLDRLGPDGWCGYSYAWLGSLKARALDGDGAAQALRDFASCFCLPNGFHVNGDQCRAGKSKFTYRPFTLEGNFAFAAGLQEMLLQSHTGVIRVFPAVPAAWADAAFDGLRADGAFLVSARRAGGRVAEVRVRAEKGGLLRLANPFAGS
ncbi:MAG: glycoside hydrolase family 95-like protein, partial [Candidatus Aminicenantales bacterium]